MSRRGSLSQQGTGTCGLQVDESPFASGGLGHLYCTGYMSLTALPCLPALKSSSSAFLGGCHLLIADMGVLWLTSQTSSVQGTYAVLILML